MCRSIKRLREGGAVAGDDEIREAAQQFVRKVTGFSKPAAHNEAAFNAAVDEIARASKKALTSLEVRGAARPRGDAARKPRRLRRPPQAPGSRG